VARSLRSRAEARDPRSIGRAAGSTHRQDELAYELAFGATGLEIGHRLLRLSEREDLEGSCVVADDALDILTSGLSASMSRGSATPKVEEGRSVDLAELCRLRMLVPTRIAKSGEIQLGVIARPLGGSPRRLERATTAKIDCGGCRTRHASPMRCLSLTLGNPGRRRVRLRCA
jgi:hypothetical protein